MTTLYDVLDVGSDCNAETVKEAFRKAAKVHHPDLNVDDPDATARFRQIVRAKTILSDPELRAVYDRMLDFEHQQPGPSSRLTTTLEARHIVILAAVLAGAFTLFTYFSPVATVKVTEDAARQPVNVVDVRSPPPRDASARDKSDGADASVPSTAVAVADKSDDAESSVPSTVTPPTNDAVAVANVAPALGAAPTPTAVQEAAGVVDAQPQLPTNAAAHDRLDDSVLSPIASSSTVSVVDTVAAPSVAPPVTEKAIAAIHSDELRSTPPVKDARFYREQGVAAYHSGDIALAIADFNLAIRLRPNFKRAYVDRGIAFYRIGKFDRAFADIARAIRIEKSR